MPSRYTRSFIFTVGLLLYTALQPATAADSLNVYIGGAIGQGKVSYKHPVVINPNTNDSFRTFDFSGQGSAWKVLVGTQPLSWLGTEVEFINFGTRHDTQPTFNGADQPVKDTTATQHTKALAALAVVHLPLPSSKISSYGKIGVAQVRSTVDGERPYYCITYSLDVVCYGPLEFHNTKSDTHVAYGVGLQIKKSALALRAEYEHIGIQRHDPSLLSLGLTWIF